MVVDQLWLALVALVLFKQLLCCVATTEKLQKLVVMQQLVLLACGA